LYTESAYAQDETVNEAEACVTQAYTKYTDDVTKCTMQKQGEYIKDQKTLETELEEGIINCPRDDEYDICVNALQVKAYEKISELSNNIQNVYKDCSEGVAKQNHIQATSKCYDGISLGWVWDTPVLKSMLQNQSLDYTKLDATQASNLGTCIEDANYKYDFSIVSADTQRAIATCFKESGLDYTFALYESAGVAIDCASETLDIQEDQDILNFAQTVTPKQKEYISQCIVKRTTPIVAGIAVLNIPFAAGFGNSFIFIQFLFTQPFILFVRRKNKNWGRVFNSFTEHPVDLGTVRLVDHDTNKVIKTMVTSHKGKYLFLPAPGLYRVEVDKSGFEFPSTYLKSNVDSEVHYFGEEIKVQGKLDVVDKHIPIDPHHREISVGRFTWRIWKKRVAIIFAFAAPLLAALGLLFVLEWWSILIVIVHVLLLLIFIRLVFTKKDPQFGRVYTDKNTSLRTVQVSLFRKKDNKLLGYYVTDLFGRYFLPAVEGEYILTFSKKGYEKKNIDINVDKKDADQGIINIDTQLKKDL